MLGFGKKKMDLIDVATVMAAIAVPDKPLEQDIWFQENAISEGIEIDKFTFEVLALELFTFCQIINRERLEGRIDKDVCLRLSEEFLQAAYWRIQNVESTQLIVTGVDFEDVMTVLTYRNEQYSDLLFGEGASFDKVPELFAQFCDLPDSIALQWIGRTVLLRRGNAMGDWLKTLKIIY